MPEFLKTIMMMNFIKNIMHELESTFSEFRIKTVFIFKKFLFHI